MKLKINNIIYKLCLCNVCTLVWGIILWNVFREQMWQSNLLWIIFLAIACCVWRKEKYIELLIFHKFFIVVSNLLLSFCLIGNKLFCYPLNKNISIVDIIEYIIFAVAGTPLVLLMVSITTYLKKIHLNPTPMEEKRYRLHFLSYLLIPICVGIISMQALNPCIVSYDAYEVIAEAKGLTPIQDYAGILYVLWFKFWLAVCDSVKILCFIQILLYATVFGIFFINIEKKLHVRHSFLVVIYLIFSVMPNNIMMLITLSKDVYYAIALMMMTIAFMQLADYENTKNYIVLSISMIFVWSIRQSGILIVLIVSILSFILLKRKKCIILFASLSIFVSIVLNYGLYNVTNAEPVHGGLKYIALYQDILGVYYNGGNISETTKELVNKGVGDNPEFDTEYTPYWAFYDYYYPELKDQNVVEFIICYIDTFVKNPIIMSRAILCRLDMLWDIRPGVNAFESWQWRVDNSGGGWTYLVDDRNENLLTSIINIYGEGSKALPYKNIVWRVAALNYLMAMQFFRLGEKNRIVVLIPFAGYVVSYMISLGWSHYRYYWADGLMMFILCLYFISFRNSEDDILEK